MDILCLKSNFDDIICLDVENQYFDDDYEGCETLVLEDNKLNTIVKFKDISGRKRPVSCLSWQIAGVSQQGKDFRYFPFY